MFSTSCSLLPLPPSASNFDLDRTLESGQVFRWKRDADQWWVGLIEPSQTCVRIRQTGVEIEISVDSDANANTIISDYFRLHESLESHETTWRMNGGPEIADAIGSYAGLRIIRQDPVECLFSFLMSSAAPIHRIRRSMEGLAETLGNSRGRIGGIDLYAFPSIDSLAETPRETYDRLGFGFRGANIRAAAAQVVERGGAEWLRSLGSASYSDAKAELVQLRGVGEKIADCVCLFALGNDEAVPIDVHMARIARVLFDDIPASLTPKAYAHIASCYRERFGAKAGWAQQYLYYAQIAKAGVWDDALGRHRKTTA